MAYRLPSLQYLRLRFVLSAHQPAHLPAIKGSLLRGAFGQALRRTVCVMGPHQPCPTCMLRKQCVYPRLFETLIEANESVPRFLQGLPTAPRPYIFESADERRFYEIDENLSFDLILIGQSAELHPFAIFAVAQMAEQGLGARRLPFRLEKVYWQAFDGKPQKEKSTAQIAQEKPEAAQEDRNDLNRYRDHVFWDLLIALPPPLNDRPPGWKPEQQVEPYRFGFFVDFQDSKWFASTNKKGKTIKPKIELLLGKDYRVLSLAQHSHHLASSEEKQLEDGEDVESDKDSKEKNGHQSVDRTWITTAFGNERIKLSGKDSSFDGRRDDLLKMLLELQSKSEALSDFYPKFLRRAKEIYHDGLGETRRPLNDIRLWDLSHSTASFFKSGVAGLICSARDKDALTAGFQNDLHWHYLTLSIDFFRFAASAQKIIDVVARREKLEAGYAVVKKLLEMEYPLANEIYRDEYGSVYLISDAKVLDWSDDQATLREKILHCFRVPTARGDKKENISEQIIKALPALDDQFQAGIDKKSTLQDALNQRQPLNSAYPKEVEEVWKKLPTQNPFAAVCPVCDLRQVGYDDEGQPNAIARDRKICAVCLSRRSGRARRWREEESQRTIWIEEGADENGRAALLCGRFILDDWLNGRNIRSIKKNSSFARIQRCWETTKAFWWEIQEEVFPHALGEARPRLVIHTRNLPSGSKLGPFQTCKLKLEHMAMNVVVCDRDQGIFVSADNLLALAQTLPSLGKEAKVKIQRAKEYLPNAQKEVAKIVHDYLVARPEAMLTSPGHYGEIAEDLGAIHVEEVDIEQDNDGYTPLIPILNEPETFMCIVPANKALTLAEIIKTKYATEMGKVRDRLPLHLGIVFFQKYVPAGAVLDAGRRLLENASSLKEEAWQIQDKIFYNGNGYPVALDDATEVELHLHQQRTQRCTKVRLSLRLNPEEKDPDLKWDKIHPQLHRTDLTDTRPLWAGEATYEEILFTPSTFDYLFLDAA